MKDQANRHTAPPLPRERVLAALSHRESDICPYYIWIDSEMAGPLSERYGVADIKESVIHDHVVNREVRAIERAIGPDEVIDEFGTLLRIGNIPHVERPALERPTLNGYEFPDLTTDEHFICMADWLETNRDRFRVIVLATLFWERTWSMRGMEQIMMDFHDHPSFVDGLLEGLESVCLGVVDKLLCDFGEQIDAVGFTDDMGSQRGMLISPRVWRRFIKPHQQRLFERVRRAGKTVYLHTCGHVEPIVGELVDMGVNILQPIQPEAMDIYRLKAEYGQDLCFAGGVSAQRTLPFGTPDEVRSETLDCIRVMGQNGGYIVAPSKPIMQGVPIENAVAFIDTIVHQRHQG